MARRIDSKRRDQPYREEILIDGEYPASCVWPEIVKRFRGHSPEEVWGDNLRRYGPRPEMRELIQKCDKKYPTRRLIDPVYPKVEFELDAEVNLLVRRNFLGTTYFTDHENGAVNPWALRVHTGSFFEWFAQAIFGGKLTNTTKHKIHPVNGGGGTVADVTDDDRNVLMEVKSSRVNDKFKLAGDQACRYARYLVERYSPDVANFGVNYTFIKHDIFSIGQLAFLGNIRPCEESLLKLFQKNISYVVEVPFPVAFSLFLSGKGYQWISKSEKSDKGEEKIPEPASVEEPETQGILWDSGDFSATYGPIPTFETRDKDDSDKERIVFGRAVAKNTLDDFVLSPIATLRDLRNGSGISERPIDAMGISPSMLEFRRLRLAQPISMNGVPIDTSHMLQVRFKSDKTYNQWWRDFSDCYELHTRGKGEEKIEEQTKTGALLDSFSFTELLPQVKKERRKARSRRTREPLPF